MIFRLAQGDHCIMTRAAISGDTAMIEDTGGKSAGGMTHTAIFACR